MFLLLLKFILRFLFLRYSTTRLSNNPMPFSIFLFSGRSYPNGCIVYFYFSFLQEKMASTQELAVIYAILALQDEQQQITPEKIQLIVEAAGVSVEPFWAGLYAKSLQGVDVQSLLSSIGTPGAGAAAPAAAVVAPSADQAPAKEQAKKKEEPKEESDDDMGFGLFD